MLSFGRKKKKEDWQTQGRAVATLKERANASLEVIICVAALLGIGTVMVYSATSVFADNSRYGVDALYFVMKHLQSIVVGVCAGWIVTKIPMSFWQSYALWVFFGRSSCWCACCCRASAKPSTARSAGSVWA